MTDKNPARLSELLSLSPIEARLHLDSIIDKIGLEETGMLLSQRTVLLLAWRKSQVPASHRRTVWYLHSLLFNPEAVSSLMHMATWGRLTEKGLKQWRVEAIRRVKQGKAIEPVRDPEYYI